MEHGDLRHAYAVLELSAPVTEATLKHRYKELVRRWHPDRYQADPVGQAEATERLRDINIAYDLVEASLASAEPGHTSGRRAGTQSQPPEHQEAWSWSAEPKHTARPETSTTRPFPWSAEQVDAVVDSINKLNSWSLFPEMSLNRWLSIGAVLIYFLASTVLMPADVGQGKRDIARAISRASAYLWLPLYLIWEGDRHDAGSLRSRFFQITGWAFMAAPAVLFIAFFIAG